MTNPCPAPALDVWARELFEKMRDTSVTLDPERFNALVHACGEKDCETFEIQRGLPEPLLKFTVIETIGAVACMKATRVAIVSQSFRLPPQATMAEAEKAADEHLKRTADDIEPQRDLTVFAGDRNGLAYAFSAPFVMEHRIGGYVRKYGEMHRDTFTAEKTGGLFRALLASIQFPGIEPG